jgi:microcystin-dependent protein
LAFSNTNGINNDGTVTAGNSATFNNAMSTNATGITASFSGVAQGGASTPIATVQPTLVVNCLIKTN